MEAWLARAKGFEQPFDRLQSKVQFREQHALHVLAEHVQPCVGLDLARRARPAPRGRRAAVVGPAQALEVLFEQRGHGRQQAALMRTQRLLHDGIHGRQPGHGGRSGRQPSPAGARARRRCPLPSPVAGRGSAGGRARSRPARRTRRSRARIGAEGARREQLVLDDRLRQHAARAGELAFRRDRPGRRIGPLQGRRGARAQGRGERDGVGPAQPLAQPLREGEPRGGSPEFGQSSE